MNLTDLIFTDADKAREHLEATRWPDGPVCPHCGVIAQATALRGKAHRAGVYQCNACREQFTVTVGTVFERSKVPLNKWMLASYMMASSRKGVSALQMQRSLGVTYKTAWLMGHRIREAMHRYLSEFDFRYNTRSALGMNDAMRSDEILRGVGGKRLTYRRTSEGAHP